MPDYTIEVLDGTDEGEEWTADIGSFVSLSHDDLDPTSVVASDAPGSTLEEGTDYELDHEGGRIKALAGGSLPDGESCSIEYTFFTVEYDFVVENVQPVVSGHPPEYQGYTKMPVWQYPDAFPPEVTARGDSYISPRVRDSSDEIVVHGEIRHTVHTSGIADGDLVPLLIEIYYEGQVESLPTEESPATDGPPSYPTPWGRYVDRSKLTDRDVEGTSYCW